MKEKAEAGRLFSEVLLRLTKQWSEVYGFRELAMLGLRYATQIKGNERRRAVEKFISGPESHQVFLDKTAFLAASGGPETIGKNLSKNQLIAFKTSVELASLMFMHSALDGALFDLCRVTVLQAPEKWWGFVMAHKVALAVYREDGYDKVVSGELQRVLEVLERESLLTKSARLFEVCQPPGGYTPIRGYRFNRERLEELDRARQEVIHGLGISSASHNTAKSLKFLLHTGYFFAAMINYRFGLRVDPKVIEGILLQPVVQTAD
jgi:hypothetical protein